jgi:hypothetical protein
MSDTPKFEVIDRRKYKAEEEEREAAASASAAASTAAAPSASAAASTHAAAGTHPATPEPPSEPNPEAKKEPKPEPKPEPKKEEPRPGPQLVTEAPRPGAAAASGEELETESELPPAPTPEESRQQKMAYDASSQRLEDLIRAQNPGVGPQPAVTFDHLVNQLYVSAMIQMGAGQDGQRARIDILGAKQTIDLMGILTEKTKGNLTEAEERTLETVLYEVRMAFLELTNMISMQSMQPPPGPPPGKR